MGHSGLILGVAMLLVCAGIVLHRLGGKRAMKSEVKSIFLNEPQNRQIWVCPECETENSLSNEHCIVCGQKYVSVPRSSIIPNSSAEFSPQSVLLQQKKKKIRTWLIILLIVFIIVILFLMVDNSEIDEALNYFQGMDYYNWWKDDALSDIVNHGWVAECSYEYSYLRSGRVLNNTMNADNKTILLTVSKGLSSEDCSTDGSLYLTISQNDIYLNVGESVDLTVTVNGVYPSPSYLNASCTSFNPDLETLWITTTDITITGKSISEGYVRFGLYDSRTDECICYTDIYITVL